MASEHMRAQHTCQCWLLPYAAGQLVAGPAAYFVALQSQVNMLSKASTSTATPLPQSLPFGPLVAAAVSSYRASNVQVRNVTNVPEAANVHTRMRYKPFRIHSSLTLADTVFYT